MNSIERHEAFIKELRENLQLAVEQNNFEMISFYAKMISDLKKERPLIEEMDAVIRRILNMR